MDKVNKLSEDLSMITLSDQEETSHELEQNEEGDT